MVVHIFFLVYSLKVFLYNVGIFNEFLKQTTLDLFNHHFIILHFAVGHRVLPLYATLIDFEFNLIPWYKSRYYVYYGELNKKGKMFNYTNIFVMMTRMI